MTVKKHIVVLMALLLAPALHALDPREVINACQANFNRIQDIQAEVSVTVEGEILSRIFSPLRGEENAVRVVKIKRPKKRREENGGVIEAVNLDKMYFKKGEDAAVTVLLPAEEQRDLLLEPGIIFDVAKMLESFYLEIGREWKQERQFVRIDAYESAKDKDKVLMRYYIDVTNSAIEKVELFDAKGKAYRTFELGPYVEQNGVFFPQEMVERTNGRKGEIVRKTGFGGLAVNGGVAETEFVLE